MPESWGGRFECFFVEVVVTSTLLPCEGGFDKVNDFVIRLEILAKIGSPRCTR